MSRFHKLLAKVAGSNQKKTFKLTTEKKLTLSIAASVFVEDYFSREEVRESTSQGTIITRCVSVTFAKRGRRRRTLPVNGLTFPIDNQTVLTSAEKLTIPEPGSETKFQLSFEAYPVFHWGDSLFYVSKVIH